jgi:hypothetical protein
MHHESRSDARRSCQSGRRNRPRQWDTLPSRQPVSALRDRTRAVLRPALAPRRRIGVDITRRRIGVDVTSRRIGVHLTSRRIGGNLEWSHRLTAGRSHARRAPIVDRQWHCQQRRQCRQAWTAEEDQRLAAAFDAGENINTLTKVHGRSRLALEIRLAKLGRLPMPEKTLYGNKPQALPQAAPPADPPADKPADKPPTRARSAASPRRASESGGLRYHVATPIAGTGLRA